jgi:hypothetical protein
MPALAEAMRGLWRAPLFSPLGFLRSAALVVGLFAALHVAGARESTSVLSGTASSSGAVFLGGAYAAAYFGTVLGAPIVVIAAALFAASLWLARRGRPVVG